MDLLRSCLTDTICFYRARRVLYLALSPDGQTAVTAAGDETLRFWNVFPPDRRTHGAQLSSSALRPSHSDAR